MDKITTSTDNQKSKSTFPQESQQKNTLENELLEDNKSRTPKGETQQQVVPSNVASKDNNIEESDGGAYYSIHSETLRRGRLQRLERERQELERDITRKLNEVLHWARGIGLEEKSGKKSKD
ncbi:hypothetical protein [Borrelia sp. RT1S]|nr:hypothetical protein [Borrelia sp. RT1S]UGQ17736.1 hypothetical protein LSO05_04730 [Borrelia sp. RT1S]